MVVQIVLNDMFNISQMSKSQLIILPTLLHTSTHLEKRGLHRYKVYILVGEKIRTIGTLDVKISGFVLRTYPVSRTCKRLYMSLSLEFGKRSLLTLSKWCILSELALYRLSINGKCISKKQIFST